MPQIDAFYVFLFVSVLKAWPIEFFLLSIRS